MNYSKKGILKSNPIYLLQTRSSLNLFKTPSGKKKPVSIHNKK